MGNEEVITEATVVEHDVEEVIEVSTEVIEATSEAAPVDSIQKITDIGQIETVLEAVIFASPRAMTLQRLKNLLSSFHYETADLTEILSSLEQRYAARGIQMVRVAGGYQFRTHPEHADVLRKLLEDKPARLSPSALEVLAIVAYKQPLTRTEVDNIRGVESGHLVKGLMEKDLIRTQGHAETPGRPLLYGTTSYFLEVFGLGSLDELPSTEEFERELQAKSEGGGLSADPSALSEEAAALDRLFNPSPLAANPMRGVFDEPAEEEHAEADFGAPA